MQELASSTLNVLAKLLFRKSGWPGNKQAAFNNKTVFLHFYLKILKWGTPIVAYM